LREGAKRLTVGVTGASGAIYAVRTLRALLMTELLVDLIVSETGWMLLRDESGFDGKRGDFGSFLESRFSDDALIGELRLHQQGDFAAPISSGSVDSLGTVIVPCSMRYLAGVANGSSSNLIERAADVTLKEHRRLVLVIRETPMNLVQLRNQVAVAEAGAVILPASPAFYQAPASFDDLADFIAGRILNLFNIPHQLFPSWQGE
jgi:4-hydroxy-3-polyprenylbenzoate decarboxylase